MQGKKLSVIITLLILFSFIGNTQFYTKEFFIISQSMGITLNWSFETGNFVASSPVIVDINDDNEKEIIFGSDDNFLYCLNADGSLK